MADPRSDRPQNVPSQSDRPGERSRSVSRPSETTGTPSRNDSRRSATPSWRQDPFWMLSDIREEMDRVLESFGLSPLAIGSTAPAGRRMPASPSVSPAWAPQLEIFERGNNIVVRADLPGLGKDDVHAEIRDDILTIEGERRSEREDSRDGYFHSERSYGSFRRSIALPEGISADSAKASFENGVLEISLEKPRQQSRQGKKIEISQSGDAVKPSGGTSASSSASDSGSPKSSILSGTSGTQASAGASEHSTQK